MQRSTRPLAERAARASIWTAADGVVRGLVTLAVTVVLARLVTPAEFGVVAMILVFSALASVLVDFGIGSALIQRRDLDHATESTAFHFNVALGALLALALGFSGPWIARFFGEPLLAGIAWVMAANLFVGSLGAIHATLLARALQFRPQMLVGLWASVLSGALAMLLAWRGHGAWSLAWQVLAQTTITTALLWWWHPWRPARTFDREALRHLVGFGGHFMGARLIDAVYTRLYSLFIGKAFGAADLGFYSRAQSTQQMPAGLLSRVLNRVALPAFAETAHDPRRLARALAKASRVLMFVNVPAMLGIALVAEPLVDVVFGPRWRPSVPLVQVLALAGVLWPLQVLNVSALVAQGHARLLLRLEFIKKSIGIVALVAASPWGLVAIAWGQVLAACLAFFINSHHAGRLLGFGALAQLRAVSGVALAGLLMTAAVLGLDAATALAPLPRLLLLVLAGATAYLVASLAIGELSPAKVRETIRLWWPGAEATPADEG